jgi:hypothetical protein
MRIWSVAWMSAALLCGCSQEDPGDQPSAGTGGDGPSAGAGGGGGASVATDYYPMVDGSTLTYRHDGNAAADEATTVSDAEYTRGEEAWLTEGAPDSKGESSKNTIIRIGTQILRAHKEEFRNDTLTGIVEYEPGFIRFDRAWADQEQGFMETISYKRIEKSAGGTVIAEDMREHTYTIEGKDVSVTVAAGTIDNCLQVRRLRARGNPANASEDDDKIFWFCQGIGKVREEAVVAGGGGTEELVSCEIPGGSCP